MTYLVTLGYVFFDLLDSPQGSSFDILLVIARRKLIQSLKKLNGFTQLRTRVV